jgi:hypothetical protein
MHRLDARVVLYELGSAVVYVSVEDRKGGKQLGSAFHIGDGWFATARHVVENKTVQKIGRLDITLHERVDASGNRHRQTTYPEFESKNVSKITFYPDDKVDLALFYCPEFKGPEISLDLTTDRIAYNEYLLQEVLVLGYPRIPFAKDPFLVCLRAEVSAVIEHYAIGRRHFVLSGIPRGGFSGGVALTLNFPSRTLGVITSALHTEGQQVELGFYAVLSAELVVKMLDNLNVTIRRVEQSRQGFI